MVPTRLTLGLLMAVMLTLTAGPVLADTPAPSRKAARFEISFMQRMIDHHTMAIEMAQLCEGRASHAELLSTCEQIIDAQSREVQTLQTWLSDWYGLRYTPEMSKREERELGRLASLSGAEFEIAFMEMMIAHHETAIQMASDCLDRAFHKPLIRLCERIVAAQSAEIAQFREWLCAWYNRC